MDSAPFQGKVGAKQSDGPKAFILFYQSSGQVAQEQTSC